MIGPAYRYNAVITRVIDGDTLELTIDAGFRIWVRTPVRLAGIDCPEITTDAGRSARDYTALWAGAHHDVLVETYRAPEKYGRWLGVVMAADDHQVLNDLLVESGHARPYDGGGR